MPIQRGVFNWAERENLVERISIYRAHIEDAAGYPGCYQSANAAATAAHKVWIQDRYDTWKPGGLGVERADVVREKVRKVPDLGR